MLFRSSLTITTVNGVPIAATATGAYRPPDVLLPYNTTGAVTVIVSAANVPPDKTVTVKAVPEVGSGIVTGTGALVGTMEASTAEISLGITSVSSYVLSASVNY